MHAPDDDAKHRIHHSSLLSYQASSTTPSAESPCVYRTLSVWLPVGDTHGVKLSRAASEGPTHFLRALWRFQPGSFDSLSSVPLLAANAKGFSLA